MLAEGPRERKQTFDELTAMPQRSVFATVECAGNGRSFLKERAAGVQWGGFPARPFRDWLKAEVVLARLVRQGGRRGKEDGRPEDDT